MDWRLWLFGLLPLAAMALAGWLHSVRRASVNIVDILWPLFFLAATITYLIQGHGTRAIVLLGLVGLWALRLATHLAVRNHGMPEDRRYAAIRQKNSPGFAWKSIYLVFGLQMLLAWLISLPLFVAAGSRAPWTVLDGVGIAVVVAGVAVEAIADWQLAEFKAHPENRGRVLDTGLWAWSRHPNYFGEACVWVGFGLIGTAAGNAWGLLAPALVIVLLLRVSGVPLLERDIAERRPGYRAYLTQTSSFLPRPPRRDTNRRGGSKWDR